MTKAKDWVRGRMIPTPIVVAKLDTPICAVQQGNGIAGVSGSAFIWAGYAGTYFWVDPKGELAIVFVTQAPSPVRAYYRRLMNSLWPRRSSTDGVLVRMSNGLYAASARNAESVYVTRR